MTEQDIYEKHPELRAIVETIRLHAGAGCFFNAIDAGSVVGWTWEHYYKPWYLHVDSDDWGETFLICTGDVDDKDNGPAVEPDGNVPSLALAEACGRWIGKHLLR